MTFWVSDNLTCLIDDKLMFDDKLKTEMGDQNYILNF